MTILTQNKEIINYNNMIGIHAIIESEENTKIKVVGVDKYFAILGDYKTKERAEEIILDIYSKIADKKEIYRMPKE